jgi:hypothetical protein
VHGDDAHADGHGQLEVLHRAVGEVRPLPHEHAVGHLLGVGEVGHEGLGDAEAVRDDPGDVHGGVGDALDG